MKICVKCGVEKKELAFIKVSHTVCRLCKAEKEVENAKRFAGKEGYIPEKKIEEFDEIKVLSKNVSKVFTVSIEKFNEMSEKYAFKLTGEGEVYCTEYMDEFKEDNLTKVLVLERDSYICQYCGEEGFTIDHIYPQSQGGVDHPINYLTACEECNAAKADVILDNIFQMNRLVNIYRKQLKLKVKSREYGRSMRKIAQENTRKRMERYNQPIEKVSWVDIQNEKEQKKEIKEKPSLEDMLSNTFQKRKYTEKWR